MAPVCDIALIGNGIVPLSIAWELAMRAPKLRIAIVGPQDRTGAASIAAGAMLGCFGEVTHSSLRSSAGRAKFELSRLASSAWPRWVDDLNQWVPDELALEFTRGTIVIENAVSDTLDSDNFDAILLALESYGEEHEFVSPRRILGIHPVPSARPMRAVYLPTEHAIDGHKVLSVLQRNLEAKGVTFLDDHCTGIDQVGERVSGLSLRSGDRVKAGTVVCAAGAFTTPILDTVLDPLQVQPVFAGTGIAFVSNRAARGEVPPQTVRTVNRAGSCGLHVVRLARGRDYIGATNAIFDRPNAHATAGLSHFLLQCAIDQLDQWYAHAEIEHWRVGNRPVTLDTFPLLGASGLDGLFIAAGTYRDGFHASPVIAQILADEILEGRSSTSHPFAPTRTPISVFTIEESIAECSRHAICTGFEASLVLPRLWPDDVFRAAFPTINRRIYDALQLDTGLAPDILPFLSASMNSSGQEHIAFDRAKRLLSAKVASSGNI